LQRLQNSSEINGDNLNNARLGASRHFKNKERECLKDKINELATNSNLVKDENGDLLADSHNILNSWKNYFSQLLNVHNVSDVRQIEVHTAEPLVLGPSHLEVEIAFEKLIKFKSPGSD
jgi:hypothetical protein